MRGLLSFPREGPTGGYSSITLDLSSDTQRNTIACSTASVHEEAKVPVIRDLKFAGLVYPEESLRAVGAMSLLPAGYSEGILDTNMHSQLRASGEVLFPL